MDALVKNAADKNQVKKAKKKSDFVRESHIERLREVLATPSGRRVIWEYLEFCGVFRYGFIEDARHEAFLSGQKNIGGKIIADIHDVDPGLFGELSKEMKKEEGNKYV